jgi:hypothetical protein
MYAIRTGADDGVLGAEFSGRVSTAEALRAVSQAFALAEAGHLTRAVCDIRGIEAGPDPSSLEVIATSVSSHLAGGRRIALLCTIRQLRLARKFARLTGAREEIGLFTRPVDAEAWLSGRPVRRLSRTALRHMEAPALPAEPPPAGERRVRSA